MPYADYFYGDKGSANRETSKNKKPDVTGEEAFDFAWLLHQKRNKHHWQWWVLPLDDGGTKLIPMPIAYAKEMVADWTGAGMAITGRKDPLPWYEANKEKIILHPESREIAEQLMKGCM